MHGYKTKACSVSMVLEEDTQTAIPQTLPTHIAETTWTAVGSECILQHNLVSSFWRGSEGKWRSWNVMIFHSGLTAAGGGQCLDPQKQLNW